MRNDLFQLCRGPVDSGGCKVLFIRLGFLPKITNDLLSFFYCVKKIFHWCELAIASSDDRQCLGLPKVYGYWVRGLKSKTFS